MSNMVSFFFFNPTPPSYHVCAAAAPVIGQASPEPLWLLSVSADEGVPQTYTKNLADAGVFNRALLTRGMLGQLIREGKLLAVQCDLAGKTEPGFDPFKNNFIENLLASI